MFLLINFSVAQVCVRNSLRRNSYKKFRGEEALLLYRDSIFCLCAPGDIEVRKALFDIIGSGCIPVTFHPSTLGEYYAYIPSPQVLCYKAFLNYMSFNSTVS